ncbi:MAG: rhodanese-like domain-containing protein [Saprospiraceae bacterium]|nr:rhodanese-like domain-containing protein [Saprospiraceae bacterium]
MDITVEELKKRLDAGDNNFVLIDVREPYEHEEFNIGGKLVPVGSVMTAIPDLLDHKDDEVIVYCRSGNRSGMAKQLLVASGFSNVKNTLGGMLAWRQAFG